MLARAELVVARANTAGCLLRLSRDAAVRDGAQMLLAPAAPAAVAPLVGMMLAPDFEHVRVLGGPRDDALPANVVFSARRRRERQGERGGVLEQLCLNARLRALVAADARAIGALVEFRRGCARLGCAREHAAGALANLALRRADARARIARARAQLGALVALADGGSALARENVAQALFELAVDHAHAVASTEGAVEALLGVVATSAWRSYRARARARAGARRSQGLQRAERDRLRAKRGAEPRRRAAGGASSRPRPRARCARSRPTPTTSARSARARARSPRSPR